MKRTLIISTGIMLSLFLSACGDTYDKKGYEEVENYSNEMIPESEIATLALAHLQDKDFNNDDKLEEPDEYMKEMEEINDKYWDDDKLSGVKETEMKEWRISMSRGEDEEWTIKGDELADSVYETKDATSALAEAYQKVKEDNNDENLDQLRTAMDQTDDAAADLKKMIYNK